MRCLLYVLLLFLCKPSVLYSQCSKPNKLDKISGATKTCLGEAIYSVNIQEEVNYTWNISEGGSFITYSDTMVVTWTSPGLHTVQVTPSNSCGIGDAQVLQVMVNDNFPSKPDTITGKLNVCVGSEIYNIAQKDDVSYRWSLSGGSLSSDTGKSITATWNMGGNFILKVSPFNACGEGPSISQKIMVSYSSPWVKEISGPSVVCLGTTQRYEAKMALKSGEHFDWSINNENSGIIKNTDEIAEIKWTAPGDFYINVNVKNACNNTSSNSYGVKVVAQKPSSPEISDSNCKGGNVCLGKTTYGVKILPGENYHWQYSKNENFIDSTYDQVYNSQITINSKLPGPFSLEVHASNVCGVGPPTTITGNVSSTTCDGKWSSISQISDNLNGIKFVDNMNGYAWGEHGVLLKSKNGGVSWDKSIIDPEYFIADLFIKHPDTMYAVCKILGGSGNVFKTVDGGNSWSSILITLTNEIFFYDDSLGFLIGDHSTIVRTMDGGLTWDFKINTVPGNETLTDIYFVSKTSGFAIGSNGKLIKTIDGGLIWTSVISGTTDDLYEIKFVGNNGWIFGLNGVVLTSNDLGKSWQLATIAKARDFISVFFTDDKIGYGIQDVLDPVLHSIVGSVIYSTKDGGVNWQANDIVAYHTRLQSLFFTDSEHGFAVGMGGSILKTKDGGQTWDFMNFGIPPGTRAIYFTNERQGYIAGDLGSLLVTNDAGWHWKPLNTGTNENILDVFFSDTLTGYIVGGNYPSGFIFKTIDGGVHWDSVNTGLNSTISCVFFVDPLHGFINSTEGKIGKTTDGGKQWTLIDYPLNDMDISVRLQFISADTGIAIGSHILLKTSDAGKSWDLIPLPLPGAFLDNAYFIRPNTIIAMSNEQFYKTDNGGGTWVSTGGIGRVGAIAFRDENLGIGFTEGSGFIQETRDHGQNWIYSYEFASADIQFPSNRIGYSISGSQFLKYSCIPDLKEIQGPAAACLSKAFYNVESMEGTTYLWNVADGSGIITPNANSAYIQWTSPGSHILKVIAVNSCGSDTLTKTITVSSATVPAKPDAIQGQKNICSGPYYSNHYSVKKIKGVDYTWLAKKTTESLNSIDVYHDSSNAVTLTFQETGIFNLKLLTENSCGKGDSIEIDILVNRPLYGNLVLSDTVVCPGSKATYKLSTIDALVSWSIDGGGTIHNNKDSLVVTWNLPGTYTIKATAINACTTNQELTFKVLVGPPVKTPVIEGSEAACYGLQTYVTEKMPATSYNWSISSGGNIVGIENKSQVIWKAQGKFKVSVVPSNKCGAGPSSLIDVANAVKLVQDILYDSISDKLTIDLPFTIKANATSSLPIVFKVISGPATILGDQIILTGQQGNVKISLLQKGNCSYDSVQKTIDFKVVSPKLKYSLTLIAKTGSLFLFGGRLVLFKEELGHRSFLESRNIDSAYTFYNLEAGRYITEILPDTLSPDYGKYLPTYSGNTSIIEDILPIDLRVDTTCIITLVPMPKINPNPLPWNTGQDNLSGTIIENGENLRLSANGSYLQNVTVSLYNNSMQVLSYYCSGSLGGFYFANLIAGTYVLTFDYLPIQNSISKTVIIDGDPTTSEVINVDMLLLTESGRKLSPANIYPNPVSNILYIKNTFDQSISSIKILNSLGIENVYESGKDNNELAIDVSKLPAGIYICLITNNCGVFKHTVIKQ